MTDTLKPCPFCGDTLMEYQELQDAVYCDNCFACGPFAATKREAEAEWNDRAALVDDAKASADSARLDWLDARNASLNNHYGTNYGWRLILSPNVVRLMRDGHASVSGYLTDIDLHDSEGGTRKARSCRDAIDAAMKDSKGGIHQGTGVNDE